LTLSLRVNLFVWLCNRQLQHRFTKKNIFFLYTSAHLKTKKYHKYSHTLPSVIQVIYFIIFFSSFFCSYYERFSHLKTNRKILVLPTVIFNSLPSIVNSDDHLTLATAQKFNTKKFVITINIQMQPQHSTYHIEK
jgi:hypothetical protein